MAGHDRFTRHASAPAPETLCIGSLRDLTHLLEGGSCIATDLSLGAWRGCQAATELEEQLGLESGTICGVEVSAPQGNSMPLYADFIGNAIDAEASGDRVIIDALERAGRIAARAPDYCLILAPRFGLPWAAHDAALVRFLAEALGE